MQKKYNEYSDINNLAIFDRLVHGDEIINTLRNIAARPNMFNMSGHFTGLLYESGTVNLTEYILGKILSDENPYLLLKAGGKNIPPIMEKTLDEELRILEKFSRITPDILRGLTNYDGYMPEWEISEIDFVKSYHEKMDKLPTEGYGMYTDHHTFMFDGEKIVPVKNPDPQRLSLLSGYDAERKKVIDNTLALLAGKPAANVLLYGDAGTGKSSTVKAVVNEFRDKGLRLIELKKAQLRDMPRIMEIISGNPLKFIIFIDDLSFASDDDNFGTLKAVLEGSAAAKTANAAIYVTSNRRHLVREKFSDRLGDDVHAGESREELSSLSERFGLKVAFFKPGKELYLKIVSDLAKQYNVDIPEEELFLRAEEFAIRRTGRSGRAARQFVESLATVNR